MECKRCLLTDDIQGVRLNSNGICNFCELHDELDSKFPISFRLEKQMIERIKKRGKGRKYDCLIGFSGGCDSSYLLDWAYENELRALVFHFDNGFNSDFTERNIKRMLDATGFPCIRISCDRYELLRLNKAFLLAGVSDADIPNDIAMAKLSQEIAIQYKIKTCLYGHSFRVEGSVPIGWTYMDGEYIKSVHQASYPDRKLEFYPNLTIFDQIRGSMHGITNECPYYHMDHSKEKTAEYLSAKYGWESYSGRHTENMYTAFAGWYIYKRFGIDKRIIELSAAIRSGRLAKHEAKLALSARVTMTGFCLPIILKELNMTSKQFNAMMKSPRKMFYDFKTYHPVFVKYRWFFWILVKVGFLRMTFYRKYTQKI